MNVKNLRLVSRPIWFAGKSGGDVTHIVDRQSKSPFYNVTRCNRVTTGWFSKNPKFYLHCKQCGSQEEWMEAIEVARLQEIKRDAEVKALESKRQDALTQHYKNIDAHLVNLAHTLIDNGVNLKPTGNGKFEFEAGEYKISLSVSARMMATGQSIYDYVNDTIKE